MSCRTVLADLIAYPHLRIACAAVQEWHLCAAPPSLIRRHKRIKVTDRDTDLITESLDDQFGQENPYQDRRRQHSVKDHRIRARIDQAWNSIAERTPHIRDVLVAEHGLEKTGEDVYERGRRGVIYFDCEPTSLKYVQRYFSTAGRWLSHQLGDYLQLGRRPQFEFVYDGLTPQGQQLLAAMADATADEHTHRGPAAPDSQAATATGLQQDSNLDASQPRVQSQVRAGAADPDGMEWGGHVGAMSGRQEHVSIGVSTSEPHTGGTVSTPGTASGRRWRRARPS